MNAPRENQNGTKMGYRRSQMGGSRYPISHIRSLTRLGLLAAAVIALSGAAQVHAQSLVAGWDFQTTTSGGTAVAASPATPKVFVANFGSGTIYFDGSNGSSSWFLPATGSTGAEMTAFSGTTNNTAGTSFSTTTSNGALALLGGTSNAANGKFAVFKFSMTGYSSLVISFASQRTTTGFSSLTWEYSADGTTWAPIGSVAAGTTAGTIASSFATTDMITLPTVTGLDGVAVSYVRFAGSGASASNGNLRLDNIKFVATASTPPAIPVSLAGSAITTSGFTANWNSAAGASKYFLDVATDENFGAGTFVAGFENLDVGNFTSRAITGLTAGTTYYYRVRAFNTFGTSADSATIAVITGSAAAPFITPTPTSLSGFSYNFSGPSTAQSFALQAGNLPDGGGSLTVTGSAAFEVSTTDATSGFGATASLTYTGTGSLSASNVWVRMKNGLAAGTYNSQAIVVASGATSNSITASGTVVVPALTLTTTNLGNFTATNGTPSVAKNLTITGTNLTGNVNVAPPANFEVSLDAANFVTSLDLTPTNGVLTNIVAVRIAASAPGGNLGTNNIVISSTNLTNRTVQVVGTVVNGAITLTANGLTNALALFEGETAQLGVTLSAPAPTGGVSVTVANPDSTELDFTSPIVVAEGATSAEVTLTAVSDGVFDPNQTVNLQATATDWTSSANLSVTVQNVDAEPLSYVSIASTNPASYTQNFDGLGTNTIAGAFSATSGSRTSLGALLQVASLDGWYAGKRSGSGTAALPLNAGSGEGNSGGIYSLGPTNNSDRSLGTMSSGTTTPAFGALIKNDSASTLTGLRLSFTAEFWRSSTSNTNQLVFGYGKVDGVTVTTDNFLTTTNVNGATNLNIVGPAPVAVNGALDGNAATNQVAFTNQAIPVNLAPGEVVYIRWQDSDETGSDSALAIDNFSITAEANPLLAPEFDVIAGVYLTDQTVRVSNYAQYPAGAEVRYTVDGSTPTATSTLYNDAGGILILEGNGPVTLKAIAIQTDSGTTSGVGTAIYSLPKNVANLTALRASSADGTTLYRVQGSMVMSGKTANRNTKFFQDSGAGIQIDDNAAVITSTYSVGDEVQGILGRISYFAGQLQLVPHQDFGAPVSSSNTLTPVARTLSSLSDADQARLVVLSGVEFQPTNVGVSLGIARTNFPIKDPSTASSTNAYSGYFRHLFIDGDLASATVPAGSGTVIGVVQKTTISGATNLTVAPRTTADLSFSGVTPDTTPPVITIGGDNPLNILWGGTWIEAVTAFDAGDNAAITPTKTGSVDTKVPGTYVVTYSATDSSSNSASTNLTVNVRFAGGGTNRGPDGLPDAVRFAMGADGTNAMDPSLMPVANTNSGNLVLTYHARPGSSPVDLVPVMSTDLVDTNSWTSSGVTVTTNGTTNANGVTLERRQASMPINGGTKKFLRLKATTSQ